MSHHLQGMIRVCNFQTLAHNTVDGNLKYSPTFITKYENYFYQNLYGCTGPRILVLGWRP